MDRAAIRRIDYPAMGGNQLVTESQAHKWYRQALTDNGCWAKEEEENKCVAKTQYTVGGQLIGKRSRNYLKQASYIWLKPQRFFSHQTSARINLD